MTTDPHYDTAGRNDWTVDGRGKQTSFGYDVEGRLTSVTLPGIAQATTTYVYDAADASCLAAVRPSGRDRFTSRLLVEQGSSLGEA